MGKQVVFFADDVDLNDLLAFAEQKGFRAIPDLIQTGEEPDGVLPTAIDAIHKKCFHLLPESVSPAEAFYGEVGDEPTISRLMKNVSPVIEVRPSQWDGNRLSEGRIHFNMDSHVSHFEQGEKAYEQLARFLRKWKQTTPYRFYVGPHTCNEVAEDRLKLVHWNEELAIS
ncbi:MAG: hypothetical protein JNL58_25785 [Planctomyces sp.]|nr:hypothetical protein [Planctomyces sp.]